MYSETTGSLVKTWGEWLQDIPWNYFSTITYKWDISPKRNLRLMRQLETYLIKRVSGFKLFWIMEQTSFRCHTHNHLLVQNPIVIDHIDAFLKDRNLVDSRFVKHIPYDKGLGAGYYVIKYITSCHVEYDLIYNS